MPGEGPQTRAAQWLDRLATARERVPVRDLYAGGHWTTVRSLAGTLAPSGHRVRVWVCTAGLGLLPWEAAVPPCAASFSPCDPDSISRRPAGPDFRADLRAWWSLLTGSPGPMPGQPRSLASLSRHYANDPILVAVCGVGLHALADDLAQMFHDPEDQSRASILASGPSGLESLADLLIFYDGYHRHLVGGPLEALPVRIARALLMDWCQERPTRFNLGRALDEVRQGATDPQTPRRRRRAAVVLALLRAAVVRSPRRPREYKGRSGRRLALLFRNRREKT